MPQAHCYRLVATGIFLNSVGAGKIPAPAVGASSSLGSLQSTDPAGPTSDLQSFPYDGQTGDLGHQVGAEASNPLTLRAELALVFLSALYSRCSSHNSAATLVVSCRHYIVLSVSK